MTSINFPSSPSLNDEYSFGDKTWIWNGYAWDVKSTANTIVVVDDTANTTLFPVMVSSVGTREQPKVTTSKFIFDALNGNLYVSGHILVDNAIVWTSNNDGIGSGLDADLLDGENGSYYLDYNNQTNSPAANIELVGDVTGSANATLTANSTVLSITTTVDPTLFDTEYLQLSSATLQFVTGPVTFENNVFFTGNVTTISANNLIIDDNFIYLNSNDSNTDIDFGFVGNYNDGIYRHAGFFRDASDDGIWKVFDQYLPEPDAAVDIDTNDSSFRLANFAANIVYTNRINVTSSAVVENLNADLLDGENGTYYTNYVNQVNKPAANIILTGDVSGSANALLTENSTVISINVTIQPNSVTLGTDTTGAYVANLVQGSGITLTGLTGESATPTIAANVVSVGTFVGTVSNANLLSSILTVDGAGSGLDADLLDGQQGSYYANDAAVVHITGTETITGLKTFSNSVVISTNLTSDALRITQIGTGNVFVVEDSTNPDSTPFIIDNTGNTYIGTRVNTNNSKLVANGTISETVTDIQYLVASQYDIGTDPNEIPLNQYLGTMAYQDATAVSIGNLVVDGNITVASNITVAGNIVWNAGNDGAGSGLDADLLDGNDSTYYTNYVNQTNPPAANIVLTGDVAGSANATLTANSTIISVTATIQPNSVELGTDTTGAYVANILSGNGIAIIGNTGAENTTPNITLSPTGVTAASYGNTTAVATLTVDQWGRLTAAASTPINFNYANVTNRPVANIVLTGDITGSANAVLTSSSTIFSIATTIQPNSIELGTDTTGDYVANLVQGSGVTITSGTGESSTPTIAANVVSVGTFVGAVSNANILSSVLTVDGAGSGLDADLLDGQQGSYYANDAAVVHITGTETVTGLKTFSNSVVISTNLTSDALRITQIGTGNALVVEDSTNPDSTPFVVDASGKVAIGASVAVENLNLVADGRNFFQMTRASSDANQNVVSQRKARGTNTTPLVVVSNDVIGDNQYYGYDGTNYILAATIAASVDGTPGTNDMPGRLSFFTTASGASTSTERVRINSSGNVGIGTTSPTALLHVNGNTLITTNSSTDALRITQLGTGNALIVEDSANPDSTPFVINNSGRVGIGTRSPAYALDVVGSSNIYASISAGDSASQQLFGAWSSANGDIDGLLPGSQFGTIHQGANTGHHVLGLRENDANDSFSIISGGGNYSSDLTYDTLIAFFRSDGRVGIGTSSPLANLHVNSDAIITANTATNALRITQLGTGNAFVVEDETSPDSTAFIIDNTGNTYIGTRVNTNSSKLVANGTISESVSGTQYLVASQYDIGTDPNEIPINGYLGTLAFQDSTSVVVGQLRAQGNAGIGYGLGSGSNVTQITSRTTGVTINKPSGSITLVSAAGNTSWQTFSVTNSVVETTDTIIINQRSGTDLYLIHITAVAANTFNVTFATTGGTTTEQPVFNFAVLKGSSS